MRLLVDVRDISLIPEGPAPSAQGALGSSGTCSGS